MQASLTTATRTNTLILGFVIVGVLGLAGAGIFVVSRGAKEKANLKSSCPVIVDPPSALSRLGPTDREQQLNLADGYGRTLTPLLERGTVQDATLRKSIQRAAQLRKRALLTAMRLDPEQAFEYVLLPRQSDVANQLTTGCIERPAALEGVVRVTHVDFEDGTSASESTLTTADGAAYTLAVARPSHGMRSGQTVRASGLLLDSTLLVDDSPDDAALSGYAPAQGIEIVEDTITAVTGEQKFLVLYFDFNDTTPLPTCPGGPPCLDQSAIYDQLMNPNLSSTNVFFQEASFGPPPGGVWLNGVNNPLAGQGKLGDIYPVTGTPYELPISRSCDLSTVVQATMNRAETVEGEAAIDFTRYTHVMAIGPMLNCGAAGMSYIGAGPTQTPDGVVTLGITWIARISARERIMSHELGHNFGNGHADWWDCGTAPLVGSCTRDEYGDNYDVMGLHSAHFNAYHKEIPGWLTAGPGATHEILTLTQQTGVYELSPIETNAPGLKALKIPRHESLQAYLYVEYRQPIGFDAAFPANLYEGGLLHLRISSRPYYTDLFDPTASTIEPADVDAPTLPVAFVHPDTGEPGFVDPVTGTRVRVLANNRDLVHPENSRLQVEVTLGQDYLNPTLTLQPPTPANGATVSGTVDVAATATDNFSVSRVDFILAGGGRSQTVSVPGPTGDDTYVAQLDTTQLPNGNITFTATATDSSGRQSTKSRYFVNVNSDGVAPSVTIDAPLEGAQPPSAQPVVFSAHGSDDVGVWKIEFTLDAEATPFLIDTSPPFEGTRSLVMAVGPHTVRARAYDFVGNTADQTTAFTVIDTNPPLSVLHQPIPSTLTGVAHFTGMAGDNTGVPGAEIYRVGDTVPLLFVFPIQGSPYNIQFDLDTHRLSNGPHQLFMRVTDAAGNSTDSAPINVIIDNPPLKSPPRKTPQQYTPT